MDWFWSSRNYFITKTISSKKPSVKTKKPTPKSGKNCYEKESDVIHHRCKNNTYYLPDKHIFAKIKYFFY